MNSDNGPMRDLIDAVIELRNLVNTVPDSSRQRFIGCLVEAARLAIQMDAPRQDIAERLWNLMAMTENCLTDWEMQDEAR